MLAFVPSEFRVKNDLVPAPRPSLSHTVGPVTSETRGHVTRKPHSVHTRARREVEEETDNSRDSPTNTGTTPHTQSQSHTTTTPPTVDDSSSVKESLAQEDHFCITLMSSKLALGPKMIRQKIISFSTIRHIIFSFLKFLATQDIFIDPKISPKYMVARGEISANIALTHQIAFASDELNDNNMLKEYHLLDIILINWDTSGKKISSFFPHLDIFNKEETKERLDDLATEHLVANNIDLDTLPIGLTKIFYHPELGLSTSIPDRYIIKSKAIPQLIYANQVKHSMSKLLATTQILENIFETPISDFINQGLAACSSDIISDIVSHKFPSFTQLENCSSLSTIRNKRQSLIRIEGDSGLSAKQVEEVNSAFKDLHNSQNALMNELSHLSAALKVLMKSEDESEANIQLLRRSLIYSAYSEKLTTTLLLTTVYSDTVARAIVTEIDQTTNFIQDFLTEVSHGMNTASLECDRDSCHSKRGQFILSGLQDIRTVTLAKKLKSKAHHSVSCFATQEKNIFRYNLQEILQTNDTHIRIRNQWISNECLKDSSKCDSSLLTAPASFDLIEENIYLTIRQSSTYAQCLRANNYFIDGNGEKFLCSLAPTRVTLPITNAVTGHTTGLTEVIALLRERTGAAVSDMGLVTQHHQILQFLYSFTKTDITSLVNHSLSKLGSVGRLNSHHVGYLLSAMAVTLCLSPCIVISACVLCKCCSWPKILTPDLSKIKCPTCSFPSCFSKCCTKKTYTPTAPQPEDSDDTVFQRNTPLTDSVILRHALRLAARPEAETAAGQQPVY